MQFLPVAKQPPVGEGLNTEIAANRNVKQTLPPFGPAFTVGDPNDKIAMDTQSKGDLKKFGGPKIRREDRDDLSGHDFSHAEQATKLVRL
jgi:hypothetical protein